MRERAREAPSWKSLKLRRSSQSWNTSRTVYGLSRFYYPPTEKSAIPLPYETSHLCYATPFADGVLGGTWRTAVTDVQDVLPRSHLRRSSTASSMRVKHLSQKMNVLIFHCCCCRVAVVMTIDEHASWRILYVRRIGCMSWVSGR